MRLRHHIIISFAASTLIYFSWRSFSAALVSFFSGVFIDLDHLLDYLLKYKKLNLRHFFAVFEPQRSGFDTYYLPLHSFELIIIFWLIVYKFSLGLFWSAFALGMTQHMAADFLKNRHLKAYFYFLLCRWAYGFSGKQLFK